MSEPIVIQEHLVDYPNDCGILEVRYKDGHVDRVNFKNNPEHNLVAGRFVRNVVLGVCKHLYINIGPTATDDHSKWHGQVVVTDIRTQENFIVDNVKLNDKQVFGYDIDNDFWIGNIETTFKDGTTTVERLESNPGNLRTPYIHGGYQTIRVRPEGNEEAWYDLLLVRRLQEKGYYGQYPHYVQEVKLDGEVVTPVRLDQQLQLRYDKEKSQYVTDEGEPISFLPNTNPGSRIEKLAHVSSNHFIFFYLDNADVTWELETNRGILTSIRISGSDIEMKEVLLNSSRHFDLMPFFTVKTPVKWETKPQDIVQ